MTTNADTFPGWNAAGVMPPINPGGPVGAARSPYAVSLSELSARLGNTEPRRNLLEGLLDFRARLRAVGLNQGWQWIDGSFVENVEETAGRPPNDIDVVTFCRIPDVRTQESLLQDFPDLFFPAEAKAHYGIDAYFVPLNQTTMEKIVEYTAYWHGLWSHTRDGLWKGYLQIDLNDGDDATAGAVLARMAAEKGQS